MKEFLLKDVKGELFYLPCGTLIKPERKDFFLILQSCSFIKANDFFYHSIGQIKKVFFNQNKKPLFLLRRVISK